MAVTFVAAANNGSRADGDAAGITVTHGFTLQDGDVLYVFLTRSDDLGTAWGASGSTWVQPTGLNSAFTTGNDMLTTVLRRVIATAAGEPSSYTFVTGAGAGTNTQAAVMVQIRGADNTTPEDAIAAKNENVNDFTPGSGLGGLTVATTGALGLVMHAACMDIGVSGKTAGAPSLYTIADSREQTFASQLGVFLEVAYKENLTAGTQSAASWTGSPDDSTSDFTCFSFAVKPAGGTAHTASPSDTLALTDATTKAVGQARADTVALADSVAKARGLGRTDSLALADALDRVVVAARTLADTLALTDAQAFTRALAIADTVGLSDSHTEVASKTAAPADSVALTDNFSRVSTSARSVDDAVALADARALGRGIAKADAVALTDQATPVSDKARTVDDSETLTDQFTRAVAYVRSVDDAVALSDSASPTIGSTVSQDDDVALTDSFTRVTVTLRNVADVLALTDNLNREFAALRNVADTIALTDQFTRIVTAERIVVDTVALTDLLVAAIGNNLVFADTVSLSDSISLALGALAFQFPAGYEPVLASAVTGYIDPAADGRIQFPEPVGIA